MLIRIRSKDGVFRLELPGSADFAELADKIMEHTVNADPTSLTVAEQPRGQAHQLDMLKGRTLDDLGLKHGMMLYLEYKSLGDDAGPPAPATSNAASSATVITSTEELVSKRPWELVNEDSVDKYWRSQDGMIKRPRDTTFCRHGPNSMCDHCLPLDPHDAKYHADHGIKHLSYHAYLHKLSPKSSASSSSSSAASLPPLNPLDYRVKNPCPHGHHPPWPTGICTGCQPSAITLQSQPFRMVDHLEIAGTDVIDRFLNAWRKTGCQRFGWLIGHYEPYDEVPMGIKAVVEAIHEPPQEGELDGLSLGLPWEDADRITSLAANACTPLSIVGYIFTDLTPDEDDKTKTLCKRHANSFFLSSLEVIFAAQLQRQFPARSRSSPMGTFSSRLVTVVMTGTPEGGVDISTYQVSEQAEAMVATDMIEASVDPGIVRVKEEDRTEGSARYVPDVFFRYKNEYNLEVKKSAKPAFPVEYLIVNVTHGFPQSPSQIFRSTAFGIENRPGLEDQSIEKVMGALRDMRAPDLALSALSNGDDVGRRRELAKWLSDWHLVAFLGTSGLFSQDDTKALIRTATAPDLNAPTVMDELLRTDGWQTLMTFTRESAPARPPGLAPTTSGVSDDIPQEVLDQIAAEEAASRGISSVDDSDTSGSGVGGGGGGGGEGNIRMCPHCTFENTQSGSDCEVCGLPLG